MKETTPAAMPPRSIDGANALMISGDIKRKKGSLETILGDY